MLELIKHILPAHNVLVYDVAASSSGALSVLNDFYRAVKEYSDKSIHWVFLVSTPTFEETENIKVIRLPWVKRSWLHRLFCDYVVAPRITNKLAIDKILSLQNIALPKVNVRQVIYLHQSLPFADYKFGFFENPLFWIYQNIIGKFILSSIKRAEKVIVQTNWMKHACLIKTHINADKINVVYPEIVIKPHSLFSYDKMDVSTFIYPATPHSYKRHQIIIDACKDLIRNGISDYRVMFTLTGNENTLSHTLYEESEKYNLPIKFIGVLKREDLFDLYTQSILLFPSCIESFPLPLVEAMGHHTPIIAADMPFCDEILKNYQNVSFYRHDNFYELSQLMKAYTYMKKDICCRENKLSIIEN